MLVKLSPTERVDKKKQNPENVSNNCEVLEYI